MTDTNFTTNQHKLLPHILLMVRGRINLG